MGKLGLKNMKIGTQIILTTFLIVIITIVGLFSSSAYYFADYVDKSLRQSVSYGMIGIKNFIETEMLKVQQFRDHMSENELLAEYVASGDTQALHALIAPLMRASGIDIVLVADTSGKVIARPHTPDRIGDDQSGDETVQMSLRGETWERLMSAPSSKLGYYCGTPIRAEDGQIVGMLRTARSFDNEILVDTIKKLYGFEVTLFVGSTRFNTTVMADGKRAVGTEAPERITRDVLEGGQDVVDPVQILGQDYYGAYSPIIDKSTGKTMGMYFCGEPAQDAAKVNSAMRMSVAAVSVVVFIIAAIISIFTARGISKPLKRIVALSERSRDGDLTITKEDYKYNGGGELGTLVEAMSEMIAAQQKALYQVVLTAGEVESNAAALSGLSGENASAMSDSETLINKVSGLCDANAQAIERSVSNVAEMSTGANSVAQMSVSSAESISKTTRMSKQAADSVNGLVGDIGRVDAKTAENQDKIRILSSSVAEISNFMGVIGSIADQTNLLALNAAIEAARAGEAGRGFAVVAEEVRKLAEESRNASKSVEELVALLSRNADEAISASEQSVIIVKEIMSKADATVEGLNSAISEITRANEAIQSIAAVAQEQAASSSEISRAIEDISSGTEEITSTLGELTRLSGKATGIGESVADSAQRMARGAQDLQGVLKLFRIN